MRKKKLIKRRNQRTRKNDKGKEQLMTEYIHNLTKSERKEIKKRQDLVQE